MLHSFELGRFGVSFFSNFTKFYIGWLQLYGFAESEFDDAAKFSRVGLSINVAELFTEHILIKNGNKQTLGTFEERINANKNIGDRANNFLIDFFGWSLPTNVNGEGSGPFK